jgi:hypothetical protein
MTDFTDPQLRFLQSCKARVERCRELAAEAARLGLPILAREWDALATNLENAIGNQERAFREDTLAEPPKQLDLNHPEKGPS